MTALRRRGVPGDVADEVLARYADVGMIDDEAFARAWVTSRHLGRGLARRALAGELRRKGVSGDAVGEAITEVDDDTEEATARALVARRLRVWQGAGRGQRPDRGQGGSGAQGASRDPAALARALAGMLARKGYPAGLAYRVVKDALAADEETAEVAALMDIDAAAAEADEGAATAGGPIMSP